MSRMSRVANSMADDVPMPQSLEELVVHLPVSRKVHRVAEELAALLVSAAAKMQTNQPLVTAHQLVHVNGPHARGDLDQPLP